MNKSIKGKARREEEEKVSQAMSPVNLLSLSHCICSIYNFCRQAAVQNMLNAHIRTHCSDVITYFSLIGGKRGKNKMIVPSMNREIPRKSKFNVLSLSHSLSLLLSDIF
jgi:hypothetical protein